MDILFVIVCDFLKYLSHFSLILHLLLLCIPVVKFIYFICGVVVLKYFIHNCNIKYSKRFVENVTGKMSLLAYCLEKCVFWDL